MEQVVRWNTTGTADRSSDVVFLVVILAALLAAAGQASAGRRRAAVVVVVHRRREADPRGAAPLPEVRWVKRLRSSLVVAALLVCVPVDVVGSSNQFLAAVAIVWAMAGVSLVVLTGWGGHISLGQFAIVGVGALVAGNLVAEPQPRPVPRLLARRAPPAPSSRCSSACRRCASGGCSSPSPRWPSPSRSTATSSTSTTSPTSCPRTSSGPFLWERFDLERQLHDVPAVPRVPRAVDARRHGRAQGAQRARRHRHPRQPAGRRRGRGADHQREAVGVPARRA